MPTFPHALAGVLILASLASTRDAAADGHEKPYSSGPVTGTDFQQTPPSPRPIHDGVELKAEAGVGITIETAPFDSTAGTNADGTVTIEVKTEAPTASSLMDRSQSWIDPALRNDQKLLDHEQGHLDLAEAHARELQARYNRMKGAGDFTETAALPPGATAEEIQQALDSAREKIQRRIDAEFAKAVATNDAANVAYDRDTEHGTLEEKQKAARTQQRAALSAPNTAPAGKKGASVDSASQESIRFDPVTGRLTIDDDIVIGIDALASGFVADPDDPVLDAEILLQPYALAGMFSDGPFIFSGLTAAPELAIDAGGNMLFRTTLPYLLYDPHINLFYGLAGPFEEAAGVSRYVDHLAAGLRRGPLALFGIEFRPEIDFFAATQGFTVPTRSAFTNSAGARAVSAGARAVPEPGTLALFGCAVVVLRWSRRRVRLRA